MSKMPWFRLYSDVLSDRKLARICRQVKQPKALVLGVWVTLLALANESPNRGHLLISENMPLTDEEIRAETGLDEPTFNAILDAFCGIGLMERGDESLKVVKWDKRQFKSDSSTTRVQRHRERQAQEDSNATETLQEQPCNTPDPDPEEETESEAERHATAPLDPLFDVFERNVGGDKPNGRPEGWDHVSAAVFAICIRVADLWCAGKLPSGTWGTRIEKQCAGASELLGYHDGDLQAALATLDKYHLHYEDGGGGFTVTGPQSLVNVLPPFMQGGGKSRRTKRDLRRDGGEWIEEELAEAAARSLALEPLDPATFFEEDG